MNEGGDEDCEDSETDDDEDAATGIDFAAVQRLREATRTEVDAYVASETSSYGQRDLDKVRGKVAGVSDVWQHIFAARPKQNLA